MCLISICGTNVEDKMEPKQPHGCRESGEDLHSSILSYDIDSDMCMCVVSLSYDISTYTHNIHLHKQVLTTLNHKSKHK